MQIPSFQWKVVRATTLFPEDNGIIAWYGTHPREYSEPLHEHPCGSTPHAHDHRVITASQRVAPIAAACNGNRCEGRRALQREQQPAMRCYLLTRPAPSRVHARAHGLMTRAFTANGLPLGKPGALAAMQLYRAYIYRAYI